MKQRFQGINFNLKWRLFSDFSLIEILLKQDGTQALSFLELLTNFWWDWGLGSRQANKSSILQKCWNFFALLKLVWGMGEKYHLARKYKWRLVRLMSSLSKLQFTKFWAWLKVQTSQKCQSDNIKTLLTSFLGQKANSKCPPSPNISQTTKFAEHLPGGKAANSFMFLAQNRWVGSSGKDLTDHKTLWQSFTLHDLTN